MARWIAANTLAELAVSLGVTEANIKTFLATHRANGNIDRVLAYVAANPGADNTEIEAAMVLSSTIITNILALLKFTRRVDSF
jgi:predicted transcriptional regulator